MESIKTYSSIEEAFSYKPVFPDYDLQFDCARAGMRSYVRKQNLEGVWYLIPVIQRFEFGEDKSNQVEKILEFVKSFNETCYRVLLFYKIPKEGNFIEVGGRIIGGEVDPSQISERERLYPIGDTLVTKQTI
jgi:hypothetical protein